MRTNWRIWGMLLLAFIQLAVPLSTRWQKEEVLEKGTLYKFKTMPIDPHDPLRGKFMVLNFEDNTLRVDNAAWTEQGKELYIEIVTDSAGFAHPGKISDELYKVNGTYLKIVVGGQEYGDSMKVYFDYPFTRYYMEESKAPKAEKLQQRAWNDSLPHVCYAAVKIWKGEAVLEDVLIDDKSVQELVND